MPDQTQRRSAISLFSGAGGMDVGFARAGFETYHVCEIDRDACETFSLNLSALGHVGNRVTPTSVTDIAHDRLKQDVAAVFGGPPCQGFSVAGKMDPNDVRSDLIFSFFDVVDAAQPRGFVCENVKALAVSERWESTRRKILGRARKNYRTALIVLNATDFGVPQMRERMFLVGIRRDLYQGSDQTLEKELQTNLRLYRRKPLTVAEIIRHLGPAGTALNPRTCTAKISYAKAPILRKSPYAGMLFNGAGRPLPTSGYATTLPASMGGNKTPIIDEAEVFDNTPSFVETYHASLLKGEAPRNGNAPDRLRRLTIRECMAIQTFPEDYRFYGKKSAIYRQIGNAVPCDLAEAIARSFRAILELHEARAAILAVA